MPTSAGVTPQLSEYCFHPFTEIVSERVAATVLFSSTRPAVAYTPVFAFVTQYFNVSVPAPGTPCGNASAVNVPVMPLPNNVCDVPSAPPVWVSPGVDVPTQLQFVGATAVQLPTMGNSMFPLGTDSTVANVV